MTLPLSLTQITLSALPPPLLARAIDLLLRKMAHRHPRLFRNLSRLDPSVVFICPVDVPYNFLLTFGGGESVALRVVEEEAVLQASATVKGRLSSLLKMLEGEADGDMLFFSRDLTITGNTAAIVALRNIMDREEVDLSADVASLFGPFATPAQRLMGFLENAVGRIKEDRSKDAEISSLRQEISAIKNRLAEIEIGKKP